MATQIQSQSLSDLLDYFIGTEMNHRIMEDPALIADLQNHWLVRESAAVAFSQGYFQFDFLRGYKVGAVQSSLDLKSPATDSHSISIMPSKPTSGVHCTLPF